VNFFRFSSSSQECVCGGVPSASSQLAGSKVAPQIRPAVPPTFCRKAEGTFFVHVDSHFIFPIPSTIYRPFPAIPAPTPATLPSGEPIFMASAAKIKASRLNGAKSRGPITAQGKKTSSLNALKHGLTAKTLVLWNENHSLFENVRQSYIDSLQPTSSLELELTQTMVTAEWRLRRAWALETALAEDMLLNSPGPNRQFFSGSEPKPAADTNSQSQSHQQLVAKEEFPPPSEPKT
jgi:hypothetical protein